MEKKRSNDDVTDLGDVAIRFDPEWEVIDRMRKNNAFYAMGAKVREEIEKQVLDMVCGTTFDFIDDFGLDIDQEMDFINQAVPSFLRRETGKVNDDNNIDD